MKLTPEILRGAADRLIHSIDCYVEHGEEFMCHAVEAELGGPSPGALMALIEFGYVLTKHGVIRSPGKAMKELHPRSRGDRNGSSEERQAVRFMFLEFLALSMEDDQ